MSNLAAPELPEGTIELHCDGGLVLARVSNWQVPGDLYVFAPGDTEARQVYRSSYAGTDPETMVRPQVVRYPARDGVTIQGLLYLPDGAGTGEDAPPVVFDIHGGPSAESVPDWSPVVQYHVARGVAVFQPNVRGSSGLGRSYGTLDDRELREDSMTDVIDLHAALSASGLVDGDRAAVWGGSYSGYLINRLLGLYPDVFVSGVVQYGIGDWVAALEDTNPSLRASDLIEYGDIDDPEWRVFYTSISPIRSADQIRVPVLFSHGGMDTRIPFAETDIMVEALLNNGVRADYIFLPDEGHGFRKLSNRLFYYRRQAAFLEETLGLTDAAE